VNNDEIDQIKEDIKDIRNDIERIKGDTHNINRILTIRDAEAIKRDVMNTIINSKYKAAILYLTKEPKNSSDLAKELGTKRTNLNKFLNPLLEKGYVTGIKAGRERIFKRSEILDLIGYEQITEFAKLIDAWKKGLE
jgi:DNA-binding transcriptional regulator GbsR (MarR family)